MPALIPSLLLAAALGAAPPPAPPLLITPVTVIPLDSDEVLNDRSVWIRDGRIARVEPAGKLKPGRRTLVVDGRGRYLLPGFIDAHVHIATEGAIRGSKDPLLASLELPADQAYNRYVLLTLLRAGITAAANLGGSERSDADLLALRDAIAAGRLTGPRLFVGKYINGPRAALATPPPQPPPVSGIAAPTTPADGIAAVQAAKRRGYDFIKPYQFLDRMTYAAVVAEARTLRLPSSGHLPELGCAACADRESAFAQPPDNIAHAEELARYGRSGDFAPAEIDALVNLTAARRISVTPTLITLKTILSMYVQREVPPVATPWDGWVDPVTRLDWAAPRNRYLSEAFRNQPEAGTFSAGYDFARVLTRQLWRRGLRLTAGTDAPLPGLPFGRALQQEMIELREIGLSPLEVLRAASLNALALFAPGQGSGAVRPGQRADLVLLDADPLADIQNTAQVAGVVIQGRWLSRETLDAELAALQPAMDALAAQLAAREAASRPPP